MEFQECSTTKNKRCIVFYKYRYCLKRQNKDSVYWICREKSCSASITTRGNEVIKIDGEAVVSENVDIIVKGSHSDNEHKLFSDEVVLVTNCVSSMKIRAKAGESVGAVYSTTQNKYLQETGDPEATAANFPNLISIKSSLYNEQRKEYPSLPKSLNELSLNGKFTKTLLDERYLVKDEKVGEDRVVW
jgi:hypothetical protein